MLGFECWMSRLALKRKTERKLLHLRPALSKYKSKLTLQEF